MPSFTRNWLATRQDENLPATPGMVDSLGLGTLRVGLIAWAVAPDFRPIGVLLPVAAAPNLWRLLRWRGLATAAEPLLLVLHAGYAWLVLGAALLGLVPLYPDLPVTAAVQDRRRSGSEGDIDDLG